MSDSQPQFDEAFFALVDRTCHDLKQADPLRLAEVHRALREEAQLNQHGEFR